MKFGIITLVSDNYGNKYQNYAVEQLLSEYGEVETFGLEELYSQPAKAGTTVVQKLSPQYIREVLISRPMYQYDINRLDKGIIHNLIYAKRNGEKLLSLKSGRNQRFTAFARRHLHISEQKLNHENTDEKWSSQFDYFICGSDQIWNPTYSTTSDLAFCTFAPEKTICISPSFGVSKIPEYRREEYSQWLKAIYSLSVREEAGKNIIKELTNRSAEVFLDPTMLIPVEKWNALCVKPETALPGKYIVCYFLGRVTKEYQRRIQTFAKSKNLPVVMLFDITTPEYYTMDPSEVLYTIKHAEYVLTDSFHGSVFSILFHRNFTVFKRDEGGSSMNSRLETLLNRFELAQSAQTIISDDKWAKVELTLSKEREKFKRFIESTVKR